MAIKEFLKKNFAKKVEEVEKYCKANGYNVNAAEFVRYYEAGDPPWTDTRGKPVRSWKQKLIAVWAKNGTNRKKKLLPITGKSCGIKGCRLPAVYKDSTGAYDHYCCHLHMPEEVKKIYD